MAWKPTHRGTLNPSDGLVTARWLNMPIELRDGDYVEADPEVQAWMEANYPMRTRINAALINALVKEGLFDVEPLNKDLSGKVLMDSKGQSVKPNNDRKWRVKLASST